MGFCNYYKKEEPHLKMISNYTKQEISALETRGKFKVSKFMTAVIEVLSLSFGGLHHTETRSQWRKEDYCNTRSISYIHRCGGLSTFDFNYLTKLVILAHDKGLRLEISPHEFYALELHFSNRMGRRKGHIGNRHPTIEEAIQNVRSIQ